MPIIKYIYFLNFIVLSIFGYEQKVVASQKTKMLQFATKLLQFAKVVEKHFSGQGFIVSR